MNKNNRNEIDTHAKMSTIVSKFKYTNGDRPTAIIL